MTSRKSSKHSVPHPDVSSCRIAGVLEQLEPGKPTGGRPIALILHGTLGHKDYIYHRKLAERLPLDSFRFDFRGNHETPGTWRLGDLNEDLADLRAVAQYLTKRLGYHIKLVVAHSRGSIVGLHWMTRDGQELGVEGYVNVSGRYRMQKIYDALSKYEPSFSSQGFYEWKVTVARKPVVGIIRPQDMERFASFDTSRVWEHFPPDTHVLTIHGLADASVPPYDATIYARALGAREQGTHNLCLMDDADHNFTHHRGAVVDTVLDWWDKCQSGQLNTGVWGTGVRGKL